MTGTDPGLPDGTRSPRSALVLVRGLFGFDGSDRMLADSREAVELETDTATPWYAVACAALGHAGYLTADAELARTMLTAAATSPVAPRTIRILAGGIRALLEAEQGNTALSRRYAEQAMAIVTDHGMQAMPHVLPAYTASGVALAADGRLSEAMDTLEVGLRARRQTPGLSPWPSDHHSSPWPPWARGSVTSTRPRRCRRGRRPRQLARRILGARRTATPRVSSRPTAGPLAFSSARRMFFSVSRSHRGRWRSCGARHPDASRDRRRPVHLPQHREDHHLLPLPQTRCARPSRSRHLARPRSQPTAADRRHQG